MAGSARYLRSADAIHHRHRWRAGQNAVVAATAARRGSQGRAASTPRRIGSPAEQHVAPGSGQADLSCGEAQRCAGDGRSSKGRRSIDAPVIITPAAVESLYRSGASHRAAGVRPADAFAGVYAVLAGSPHAETLETGSLRRACLETDSARVERAVHEIRVKDRAEHNAGVGGGHFASVLNLMPQNGGELRSSRPLARSTPRSAPRWPGGGDSASAGAAAAFR